MNTTTRGSDWGYKPDKLNVRSPIRSFTKIRFISIRIIGGS